MPTAKSDRSKFLYSKGPYLYFRMKDGKLVPLPTDQASAEFKRSYDACLKQRRGNKTEPAPKATPVSKPLTGVGFVGGTIGRAIKVYMESVDFTGLKPRTRYNYARALVGENAKGRRPVAAMVDYLGQTTLADLDTDAVDIYSEMLFKKHSASTSNRHVYLLSSIWQVCRKHPEFNIKGLPNPTLDAAKRYKVKQSHKPWSDDDEERFMETAPDNLKLAKLLLHFGGQRGGDCVKLKWADFDGEGFYVTPEKTDGVATPEPNYQLCPAPLLEALERAPRTAETILVNQWGKSWSDATTLSHAIRKHLMAIGLVEKGGRRKITMHGLRKNAASDVGSLGVGAAGIKSITGHKSNQTAEFYARHFDRNSVNRMVVERWNEELAAKKTARVGKRRATLRRVK